MPVENKTKSLNKLTVAELEAKVKKYSLALAAKKAANKKAKKVAAKPDKIFLKKIEKMGKLVEDDKKSYFVVNWKLDVVDCDEDSFLTATSGWTIGERLAALEYIGIDESQRDEYLGITEDDDE